MGYRDGSMVNCSSRGSVFQYQHPHGDLQSSITLVLRDMMYFDLCKHYMHVVHRHKYMRNIHTHKIIISKYFKNLSETAFLYLPKTPVWGLRIQFLHLQYACLISRKPWILRLVPPKIDKVVYACNSSFLKVKSQENQKFKFIFAYTVNLRPVRYIWDPVSRDSSRPLNLIS